MEAPAADAGDADLILAAQRDPLAFDRLYDRYDQPILNYCYYRLGTWEDAEDAAQQIFTNAYANLRRFRAEDGGSFRSWLFTIAHHEVANRKRGSTRHPAAPLESAVTISDPGPTPEELAVAADRQGRVLALMSQLTADQRQVLELRFAGLTDVEIGVVLGRNPGAVRAVQARGVARLRELLGIRPTGKGGDDV
jgi:RNA polymerase sigma-70 factor (ECF subfamily)